MAPSPGRAPCVFFAAGCCRAGESCRFSHDTPAATSAAALAAAAIADANSRGGSTGSSTQVCAHYLMGSCRYGASCRRLHPPGVTLPGVGGTREGGDGSEAHTAAAVAGGGVNGGGDGEREPGRGSRADPPAVASGRPAEASAATTAECGICFDHPRSRGARYGLLSGCDHPFCLDCVRQWRFADDGSESSSSSVHKTCPLCRVKSHYVIPSVSFLTGAQKAAAATSYREHVAQIPCKYYTADGVCPFGVHCFYFHDSKEAEEELPRLRSLRGSRPNGSGRGRGRLEGGDHGHGHEGGAADLDDAIELDRHYALHDGRAPYPGADIDVDQFSALHAPEEDALEEYDWYHSMGFALDEIMQLLDFSLSEGEVSAID
ncbi:hypothetical protein MMPV_000517 [Pyropia vietnamensis]